MSVEEVFSSKAAQEYAEIFARTSGGYATSVRAIVDEGMAPFLRQNPGIAQVLEVGGGSGRSGWAVSQALHNKGVTNFSITGTELVRTQIIQGVSSFRSGEDRELLPPTYQSAAEALPFPKESFQIEFGSQVVHWLPREKTPLLFTEAFRVLVPGGRLVLATSGITKLGEMNEHHFLRHPFVRYHYLPYLERELVSRRLWNRDTMGVFSPMSNPRVNPYYHQWSFGDLVHLARQAGFGNVRSQLYMFPCTRSELEARMTGLASINMHFFAGEFALTIEDSLRKDIAVRAFNRALESASSLWEFTDTHQQPVTVGSAADGTYGEPVPVLVADKPSADH